MRRTVMTIAGKCAIATSKSKRHAENRPCIKYKAIESGLLCNCNQVINPTGTCALDGLLYGEKNQERWPRKKTHEAEARDKYSKQC